MTFSTVGFHGTSASGARDIIRSGFRVGTDPKLWYGDGAYFYEDDHLLAMEWCWRDSSRKSYKRYAILKSQILTEKEKLLDLSTIHGAKLFHDYRSLLLSNSVNREMQITVPEEEFIDGYVIDNLIKSIYDSKKLSVTMVRDFRYSQTRMDRRSDKRSGISNSYIICVKDVQNCIISTDLYKEGDVDELQ